jgi:hypothetical protein
MIVSQNQDMILAIIADASLRASGQQPVLNHGHSYAGKGVVRYAR